MDTFHVWAATEQGVRHASHSEFGSMIGSCQLSIAPMELQLTLNFMLINSISVTQMPGVFAEYCV